jgi:hypothetical protein
MSEPAIHRYDGEQIDGPDGNLWVRRDSAIQWRDRALAAERERTDLREDADRLHEEVEMLRQALQDVLGRVPPEDPIYQVTTTALNTVIGAPLRAA